MPEPIRDLVSPRQLLEWNGIDSSQLDTVIQSNFLRSYRETRDKRYAKEALMKTTAEDIKRLRSAAGKCPEEKKQELPEPKKLAFEKSEWMIRREQMQ